MRTLSILTALLFLAGCGELEFLLPASPEPGVAEPTRIPAPAAGKRAEVVVEPGQTVCLDVPDLKDARVVVRDDGLLVVLPNGGEIFLANFRPDPERELPVALCLPGGLAGIAPGAGPGDTRDDTSGAGTGGTTGGTTGGGDTTASDSSNRSGQSDDSNPGGVDSEDQGGTDNPGGGGGKDKD